MESKFIITSIGIGGAFFVGLVVFWFIFVYLKKHMTSDHSSPGHNSTAGVNWEEKRRHPRIEISWQAQLEKSEGPRAVHLKDISLGGAFVVCEKPLALQDRFKISIELPERGTLQLNAEVVWSNANTPRDKVVNRGMGIRFVNNEEKERQQLQDAITEAGQESDRPN